MDFGQALNQREAMSAQVSAQTSATYSFVFVAHRQLTVGLRILIYNIVDHIQKGYPNLAAFQDSSENFMLYRRFGYLQSRILLDKQDELRRLEERLDAFDRDNPLLLTTRSLTEDEALPRKILLHDIEQSISSYGM